MAINEWSDAKALRTNLVSDGWVSPDTYSANFMQVSDTPAVYLFMLYDERTFDRALIAYVGMSTKLKQRFASHNILPQLARPGFWPMRWFKPMSDDDLRTTEDRYIKQFNPPWNIAGRPRGVVLE